jgi:hypothetical protein
LNHGGKASIFVGAGSNKSTDFRGSAAIVMAIAQVDQG